MREEMSKRIPGHSDASPRLSTLVPHRDVSRFPVTNILNGGDNDARLCWLSDLLENEHVCSGFALGLYTDQLWELI